MTLLLSLLLLLFIVIVVVSKPAGQPNSADDSRRCVWSVSVLPVPSGPEAVRPSPTATHDADGRTASDVRGARGSDHATVPPGTQLLRQQVHVYAEQPRLQPAYVEVGRRQCCSTFSLEWNPL